MPLIKNSAGDYIITHHLKKVLPKKTTFVRIVRKKVLLFYSLGLTFVPLVIGWDASGYYNNKESLLVGHNLLLLKRLGLFNCPFMPQFAGIGRSINHFISLMVCSLLLQRFLSTRSTFLCLVL